MFLYKQINSTRERHMINQTYFCVVDEARRLSQFFVGLFTFLCKTQVKRYIWQKMHEIWMLFQMKILKLLTKYIKINIMFLIFSSQKFAYRLQTPIHRAVRWNISTFLLHGR